MITGVVNAGYEAVIPLVLQGPTGQEREIEAVIDTGFTGFLTLPPTLAQELELAFHSTGRATLADGSETTFPLYGVAVLWDDWPRYVEAGAANTAPLVGMALLNGYDLYVRVAEGGQVVVRESA